MCETCCVRHIDDEKFKDHAFSTLREIFVDDDPLVPLDMPEDGASQLQSATKSLRVPRRRKIPRFLLETRQAIRDAVKDSASRFRDGLNLTVFGNKERRLPPVGKAQQYLEARAGVARLSTKEDPHAVGCWRIVVLLSGEKLGPWYFTDDHYSHFYWFSC